MRLCAFVAIGLCVAAGALAAAPEAEYGRAKLEAEARLAALARVKADPAVIREVEDVALKALARKVSQIVGPVEMAGVSAPGRSHVDALTDSPEFGKLDGVLFSRGDDGGEVLVTTKALFKAWLAERKHARPAKEAPHELPLEADDVYGEAFEPDNGFSGVLDLTLPRPGDAAFAHAKLGRFGPGTDSLPRATLIVTVVKGERVFISLAPPRAKTPDLPACSALAATPSSDGGWGPFAGPDYEAWRSCMRRRLPEQPYYKQLKSEAQAIAARLAGGD